jgi:hypothetical protein
MHFLLHVRHEQPETEGRTEKGRRHGELWAASRGTGKGATARGTGKQGAPDGFER